MAETYVTLNEAAELEGTTYATIQRRVHRNPEKFLITKEQRETGGKEMTMVAISSLSKKARIAWKEREKLKAVADAPVQEADKAEETDTPWYVEEDITTSLGGTETVRCMIADLDTFLSNGDTSVSRHHAVIVPKDCFKTTAKMNDTAVTTGGYTGSAMHTTVLPIYAAALQTALNNHIITHRSLLTNSISTTGNSNAGAGFTGYANNWAWTDAMLSLMSEIQLYGSTVLSSSFYDTGERNTQFNLFRHDPARKIAGQGHGGGRMWYWLSAVVSASAFAHCYVYGDSSLLSASVEGCVRPYFLIG